MPRSAGFSHAPGSAGKRQLVSELAMARAFCESGIAVGELGPAISAGAFMNNFSMCAIFVFGVYHNCKSCESSRQAHLDELSAGPTERDHRAEPNAGLPQHVALV